MVRLLAGDDPGIDAAAACPVPGFQGRCNLRETVVPWRDTDACEFPTRSVATAVRTLTPAPFRVCHVTSYGVEVLVPSSVPATWNVTRSMPDAESVAARDHLDVSARDRRPVGRLSNGDRRLRRIDLDRLRVGCLCVPRGVPRPELQSAPLRVQVLTDRRSTA